MLKILSVLLRIRTEMAAVLWLFIIILGMYASCDAQLNSARAAEPAAGEPERKIVIYPPREIGALDLETRDGIQLNATFYPGGAGKESLPVILLHSWKGSRKDFGFLPQYLQSQGCAVLVPDLRGHGASNKQKITDARGNEKVITLDAARFKKSDFDLMVRYDIEKLKQYLLSENDAGKLNIDKLCIGGIEMGALLGSAYAKLDWAALRLPGIRQGQDVKAVIMISPKIMFQGFKIPETINSQFSSEVAYLIFSGERGAGGSDASKVYTAIRKIRGISPELDTSISLIQLKTSLQGAKLFTSQDAVKTSGDLIYRFLDRCVGSKPIKWIDRKGR